MREKTVLGCKLLRADGSSLNDTHGRLASNPELSFTWYDAAVLSRRVREAARPTNRFQR